jgi:hypothetical protein
MLALLAHGFDRRTRLLLAIAALIAVALVLEVGASADAADPSGTDGTPPRDSMRADVRPQGGQDGQDGQDNGDGQDEQGGGQDGDGQDNGGQGAVQADQPGDQAPGMPAAGGQDEQGRQDGGAGGGQPPAFPQPPVAAAAPPIPALPPAPTTQPAAHPRPVSRPAPAQPAHRPPPVRPAVPRPVAQPAAPAPGAPPKQLASQARHRPLGATPRSPAKPPARHPRSRAGRGSRTSARRPHHPDRPAIAPVPVQRLHEPAVAPAGASAEPAGTAGRAFSLLLAVPLVVLLLPLLAGPLTGRRR